MGAGGDPVVVLVPCITRPSSISAFSTRAGCCWSSGLGLLTLTYSVRSELQSGYPVSDRIAHHSTRCTNRPRHTRHGTRAHTALTRYAYCAVQLSVVEEYKGTSARQNLQYVNGEAQQTAKAARALRFTSSHTFRTSVPMR